MTADPFRTATLRARVLDAWAASPARFREDANAEDDLVRGGYRDRVVVELAQNAADAAVRAGLPGRLEMTLRDGVLVASNSGAPLDSAGVESLSTLRASSKRDDRPSAVGRFGVGFAAVLAVSDAPEVASTTGGVRWQTDTAVSEVTRIPALRDELSRRGGQVPVLRLPYPSARAPETGFTTSVVLPLRDGVAVDLVRRLLDEVDDALLLALPALDEVVVEVDGRRRAVADAGRWQVVRRAGRLDPLLVADRPVEERDRASWSVTWARPLAGQPVPPVLHAPTPTDEPLELPALLVASFPLDPTRRHVSPGRLTEHLVAEAAAAYVELVQGIDEPSDRLALVPGPVAAGRLDGALRTAVTEALTRSPVLRTAAGTPVAPCDAVSVVGADAGLIGVLGEVVAGLVPDHGVLARLGTRRLALADAVDLLADLDREPAWWRELYAALAAGTVDAEALGALPVPLADGRLVRGPRGALVPDGELPPGTAALGLRVVHAGAAHPLLLRLGAAATTARTVLERPEVRAAVSAAWDHDDPAALADAVLGLVEGAGLRPGELPWLAGLVLTDADGEPAGADELLLPGSALSALAGPDVLGEVHPDLVARWGAGVLAAAGVLAGLTVVEVHDLLLDPAAVDDDGPLPGLSGWVAWVLDRLGRSDVPPTVRTVRGIPELDVVGDDAWARLLIHVSGRPELRSAVLDPARVDLGAAGGALVPSYASWWIRTHGAFGGREPGEWAVPGAPGLDGLFDELGDVAGADLALVGAAGVRTSLDDLLGEPFGADELLARLGDASRRVPAPTMREAYGSLARLDPGSVRPPTSVRVRTDLVVPAGTAVVVDAPHHLQLEWEPPALVVPLTWAGDLADVLDVARSSEHVTDDVSGGEARQVPTVVGGVLDGAVTSTWWEHDELSVGGRDVTWWVTEDRSVHAATLDGLARGLAWAAGRWDDRFLVAAVLAEPDRVDELLAEGALEE